MAAKTTVLDVLDLTLEWGMFRPVLDQNLDFKEPEPGQPARGGRPPFDAVLMFKVLILQKHHALSDDQCEYQINDRHSLQRFLGLEREGRIPDAKTIWRFRERLGPEGVKALFEAFDGFLRERGLLMRAGKVIDASFVDVPGSTTAGRGISKSRTAKSPMAGSKNPPSAVRRTPTPGTRKRMANGTTAIKITSKPTSGPNSLRPGR